MNRRLWTIALVSSLSAAGGLAPLVARADAETPDALVKRVSADVLATIKADPSLRDGDMVLTQSLAILEYLEETRPQPPLLPADAAGRARVRALAQLVACDIHPLNNLRVLQFFTTNSINTA